jgi:hypothetical protein
VTPFAFGFLVFSLAATLAAAWANKTRVPVPAA